MFEHMQFNGLWRDYQQRVLNELEDHLGDNKLHIVAAPGSGKTVLGIEVMRRLAHTAVILSPSITIQNQWVERLHELFAPKNSKIEISHDLRNPTAITSATYQLLHSLWNKEEEGEQAYAEFNKLIAYYAEHDAITIIVDEAHHLRKEWWRALNAFIDALPNATLVALTATPPYDASFAEWSRYDDLCGPIDAEISIPELVRNGDLCPHQDYIHFSIPEQSELELLHSRRVAISQIIDELLANTELLKTLANHPWVIMTLDHEEEILDDPEFLSSILIILASAGYRIPKDPIEILGVHQSTIPSFTLPWLEIFLNGFIFQYHDHFDHMKSYRKTIERQCKKNRFNRKPSR